jgi:ATP-dependent Clp protease ATP-binding subunit ClpA
MFSKDLELTISQSYKEARAKRHEFMTVEHLLLALIENPSAAQVLKACGADLKKLSDETRSIIEETVPMLPADDERDTQPTLGFQRVLQRAVYHVQSSGKKRGHRRQRAGGDLRREGFATRPICCRSRTSRGWMSSTTSPTALPRSRRIRCAMNAGRARAEGGGDGEKQSALQAYASNLNDMARPGKIDPLIGRADEIERTIQVLCRRRKNNPLYVGEAGVGKTALAEGLAKRIVDNDVPEVLKDAA